MKKFISALCATAVTASVALTGVLPASAAPVFVPKVPVADQSDVIKVIDRSPQAGDGFNQKWKRRHWNNNNKWSNDRNWRKGDKYGWYNGHRGYRYKRPGYRYHDGFWFPAGAFIAGAIIGGAIQNNNNYNRVYRGNSAHIQYCYDRYRSYRASDNTFQPYNGPRQQCYSPYS